MCEKFFISLYVFVALTASLRARTTMEEKYSHWYQMAYPTSEKVNTTQHVRFFKNNLLMWKWSGRVDDPANYDPQFDIHNRVCSTDAITLEPQPRLNYIINEAYLKNVNLQNETDLKVHRYNQTTTWMHSRFYTGECVKRSYNNTPGENLTFKTQKGFSDDFFDVNNWVLCSEREFCNEALSNEAGLSAMSNHKFFDFPLDGQRIPAPTSQFLVADTFDGPDMSTLKEVLHEQPEVINVSALEFSDHYRASVSREIGMCDYTAAVMDKVCESLGYSDYTHRNTEKCEHNLTMIHPLCSCRFYCGSMIQTKLYHDVADVFAIIDNITHQWKHNEPKETKNMAIVQYCEPKQQGCVYGLQLVFNDSNTADISLLTDALTLLGEPYRKDDHHFFEAPLDSGSKNRGSGLRITLAAKFVLAVVSLCGLVFVAVYFLKRSKRGNNEHQVQMTDISDGDIEIFASAVMDQSAPYAVNHARSGGPTSTSLTTKLFGPKARRDGFQPFNTSTLDLIQDEQDDEPVNFETNQN